MGGAMKMAGVVFLLQSEKKCGMIKEKGVRRLAGFEFGTLRGAKQFFTIMAVCLAVIGCLCGLSAYGWLQVGEWECVETEFASIEYEKPERFAIPGVVQGLSWDDEGEEGWYLITDSQGRQWSLNANRGMDTGLFYQKARAGDDLTLWVHEDQIEAMTCGDTVYRSYGEALGFARSEGIVFGILAAVTLFLAGISGYCLVRLCREGERFRQKLPKWVREV